MSTYFVKWSMGLWTILPCKVTGMHCSWNDTSLFVCVFVFLSLSLCLSFVLTYSLFIYLSLPYALLATLGEIARKYSELLQDMFPAK